MSRSRTKLPVIQTTALPPLYAAWMDELLAGPIPRETEATCDDCAMCAPPGEPSSDSSARFFDPLVKCCSYMPALPNFIVGRILRDADPASAEGRATVETRLAAGIGVTPLGLDSPSVYSLMYAHQDSGVFGRSRALRCPHFLEEGNGRCGIWQYRNSVCATYFCKLTRGAVGQRFWHTLRDLLLVIERDLARWCVLEMGAGVETLRQLLSLEESKRARRLDSNVIDGVTDAKSYAVVWGDWREREREFYEECARLVDALRWREVIAVCGPDAQIQARLTRAAYKRLMSDDIPQSLKVDNLNIVSFDGDSFCVSTYSPLDPVALPKILLDLLPYFDGRPADEILRAIHEEKHIKVDRALIRKLLDFQILTLSDKVGSRVEA